MKVNSGGFQCCAIAKLIEDTIYRKMSRLLRTPEKKRYIKLTQKSLFSNSMQNLTETSQEIRESKDDIRLENKLLYGWCVPYLSETVVTIS